VEDIFAAESPNCDECRAPDPVPASLIPVNPVPYRCG